MIAGDGQVSLGNTVIKANARKVRPLGKGNVIAGFAGATADAFTLFERFEEKVREFEAEIIDNIGRSHSAVYGGRLTAASTDQLADYWHLSPRNSPVPTTSRRPTRFAR